MKGTQILKKQKEAEKSPMADNNNEPDKIIEVDVPADNIAHLMFYLDCLNTCLDHIIDNDLTNYKNYENLTPKDKSRVVVLADLLNLHLLMGKVIFALNNKHRALHGSGYQFYNIRDATSIIKLDKKLEETIDIEGQAVFINKILVVSDIWLSSNYMDPMKAEIKRLEVAVPQLVEKPPAVFTFQPNPILRRKLPEEALTPLDPLWQSDSSTNKCTKCGNEYGIWRRRHHCRNCGFSFCSDCSPLPPLADPQIRRCRDCNSLTI